MALRGKALPDKLKDSPELAPGLALYWDGFIALTSCRQIGFSIGPIPFTAILDYCREYEVEGEDREVFIAHLQSIDKAYLEQVKKDADTKK